MLELRNVSAGYQNKDVIKDISIDFAKGKITTIIGPNGCGKSTIVKVLSRIIKPSSGEIFVHGQSLYDLKLKDSAKLISVLPQVRNIPSIDVQTLVSHGRFPYTGFMRKLSGMDKEHIKKAMEDTGVIKLRYKNLQDMSGGERQKAFIAMTLSQNTDIVILDEPTTFLDISHQIEILELIKKLNESGKTIIMVLHDLSQAITYSHSIVVISDGRLVASGAPERLVERGIINEVFKVESKCFYEGQRSYYFFG